MTAPSTFLFSDPTGVGKTTTIATLSEVPPRLAIDLRWRDDVLLALDALFPTRECAAEAATI